MLTDAGRLRLIADEGSRLKIYDDKTGEPVTRLVSGGVPTIGVGRNLADRGLTQFEVEYLLNNDINSFWDDIEKVLPWISKLYFSARADVVLMVEFNTGDVFQFRKMLVAMQAGDWNTAATELLASKAALQGPLRYARMAEALRGNVWAATELTAMPVISERPS